MSKILDVRNPQHRRHSSFLPEDRHVRRILLLAFAFFVSGLVFFALRMQASREALEIPVPVEHEYRPIERTPRTSLAHLPPPSAYRMFQYHADMETLAATTTCSDTHAVVMLYQSGVDYRADPRNSLFKTAFPCTKGAEMPVTIPLAGKPLIEGNRYYIVRAQQGDGTWYNPY